MLPSKNTKSNLQVEIFQAELIDVTWNDDHVSSFSLDWLKLRELSLNRIKSYLDSTYKLPYKTWKNTEFLKNCNNFQYNDLKTTNGLRDWIESVATNGVAMIHDAPGSIHTVREIAELIGFARKTHYGESWVVTSRPTAKNYAYLSGSLPLHTDLPYYEYKPGVNLLHCFSQTNSLGGDSLIADGFYVSDRLKKSDFKSFTVLKDILVDWNDVGSDPATGEFHCIYRSPVINVDIEQRYCRINYSIPQRDSHFSIAMDCVIPWYKAYGKLINILGEQTFRFKLKEGQVFAFNNLRIFHGRTSYDDNKSNIRKMIGAYIDWDTMYARWRSLKLCNENES